MINEDQPNGAFRIDRDNMDDRLNRDEGYASPIQQLSQIPDSHLEEDVGTTFGKQFKGVAFKFWLVLFPVNAEEKVNYLRNWDLWGPYLQGILFLLIIGTDEKFLVIVKILLVGSSLTTFNIKVIGGKISYFQSLSILGYSMFPLIFTTIVLKILTLFKIKFMAIIMIAQFAACLWSILSARAFVVINVPPTKRLVAIIPIALAYFYMTSHLIFFSFYGAAWKEGGGH